MSALYPIVSGDRSAYECASSVEIRWLAFVEKVNMIAIHDLDELAIDVLQGFVVRLQRIYQPWATIQDSFGKNGTTDSF